VKLRKLIDAAYEVGQHRGRPVVVPHSGQPVFLDTPAGLNAWRYDLLHKQRFGRYAGEPPHEIQQMVENETGRQAAEAAEHGREVVGIDPVQAAVIALADRRSWSVDSVERKFNDRAMLEAVDELVREQANERALNEAASGFAWTDLSELWDEEPPIPEFLARSDGPAAFYSGQRNFVTGATESGKSWMVALAIKQEIDAGRIVAYNDHENGPMITMDRLRSLGLTRDQVRQYVRYSHRPAPLPPELAAQEAEKLWAAGARLMFADALTPIAHSLGLDTSGGDTNAVERVYQVALDPWVSVGYAAVLLDNAPKANKYASLGSQHKSAAVGGAILAVVAETPFSRHVAGTSKIYLSKDRGGNAETVAEEDRRLWGTLRISPDPVKDAAGRVRTIAGIYPPPDPPDPMERLYEEADRKAATLALARKALVDMGVTFVESMKQLADWMALVQPSDEAFVHAHVDRGFVTDVLFTGTASVDHEAAGLVCTSTSYKDRAGRRRNRYRVELIPMPATGE
jgi:hypothetical protein